MPVKRAPREERIACNALGVPHLTRAQVQRVHKYAAALLGGTQPRVVCSPRLLAAAMLELSFHASSVRFQFEQLITGMASAAPAAVVAKLAIQMLQAMQGMAPADQVTYLQMLAGDDEQIITGSITTKPHTKPHTH